MERNTSTSNAILRPTIIIGYGRLGSVLTAGLLQIGIKVVGVVSSKPAHGDTNARDFPPFYKSIQELPTIPAVYIICVPDNAIATVVHNLAEWNRIGPNALIVHTSGSISTGILAPLKQTGALCLAFHPMQTFSGSEGPRAFEGVTFGLQGDAGALNYGEELAKKLGGVPAVIAAERRTYYHLAGVFAANFMVPLIGNAVELLHKAGFEESRARDALKPIMSVAVSNLLDQGLEQAATGPLLRGDYNVIQEHLQALSGDERLRDIYRTLSLEFIRCLEDALEEGSKLKLRKLLTED